MEPVKEDNLEKIDVNYSRGEILLEYKNKSDLIIDFSTLRSIKVGMYQGDLGEFSIPYREIYNPIDYKKD
mgnify:FL=1